VKSVDVRSSGSTSIVEDYKHNFIVVCFRMYLRRLVK
jgi:hypothetical protein